jgi:hypothetical protein
VPCSPGTITTSTTPARSWSWPPRSPATPASGPQSVTPLAEILRQNGYSTAAFGKYHETPPWEVSVSGPYDRWPTGSGFDKFYGFIGGETNQWAPAIFDGVTRVEHAAHDPNYHFTTDMTNQAILGQRQQSLTPDKPFYMYFAPGATHAPHHVPKEWIAKYKGQFAGGWDKLREETLCPPEEAGRHPQPTQAHAAPAGDSRVGRHERRSEAALRAQMETFAGFAEHTDHEVGRLVAQLEEHRRAGEHALLLHRGRQRRERRGRAGRHLQRDDGAQRHRRQSRADDGHIDDWGGPTTFPHFAIGWAWAATRRSSGPSRSPALRRHAQRHGHALAEGIKADGRGPQPVPPRDRRRADRARGREASAAEDGQRHCAAPMDGVSMLYSAGRRQGRRTAAPRSTSRCSATARSTTKAGSPARGTPSRG